MTAQSNWTDSWIWGHFVQIHHVSGAAVFPQFINRGILDAVRPKKESHCSLSHDFATSSQTTDVASKEAKQLFLTKLCSWCPISYQNNLPVPWAEKIPWERSYSKPHACTKPKTNKQTSKQNQRQQHEQKKKKQTPKARGGNREREFKKKKNQSEWANCFLPSPLQLITFVLGWTCGPSFSSLARKVKLWKRLSRSLSVLFSAQSIISHHGFNSEDYLASFYR